MSNCEGLGHKAVVHNSHFPPLRQFIVETPSRILGT